MKYGILMKPNNNIPYYEQMLNMCICEAKIFLEGLKLDNESFKYEDIGRSKILSFTLDEEIDRKGLKLISNLSFYYAFFEIIDGMLKPIMIEMDSILNEDISTRLKYMGKTNEVFTRQMLNIAIATSSYRDEEMLNILDPMCSRGTSLYEAMLLGHNSYGIEMDKKAVKELETYFSRYLKEGKYEYNLTSGKAVSNRERVGSFLNYEFARDKDRYINNNKQKMSILRGDSIDGYKHFNSGNIHVVIADLPYGVQHKGKNKKGSYRDLAELIDMSLKSWNKMMMPGGVIALSWNIYTNSRNELKKIIEENGFSVMNDDIYRGFSHRVSQAITRDIIVAKKNN